MVRSIHHQSALLVVLEVLCWHSCDQCQVLWDQWILQASKIKTTALGQSLCVYLLYYFISALVQFSSCFFYLA